MAGKNHMAINKPIKKIFFNNKTIIMAEMKTVVVGDILIQDNQERKFGADPQYAVVWAKTPEGLVMPFAFTKEEILSAGARAHINGEDVPELGSEAPINKWDAE